MKSINKVIIPILLAGSISALSAAGLETADSVTVFTIDNCVHQFDSENVVPTGVGYQYWFVDKTFLDGRTLKMSVVASHSATHPPHRHHEDEFFFILEGKAEFSLRSR